MKNTVVAFVLMFLSRVIVIKSDELTFLGGPDSWAVYRKWNLREKATLNFQFKTNNSQGNLVHIPGKKQNTYLKLRLHNGNLALAVSYSAEENAEKELGTDLNDLLWHNVTITRNHRATVFELDGAQQLISNVHWEKVLDVTENVYVGNFVDSFEKVIESRRGFIGCIKDMRFAQGYQEMKKKSQSAKGSKTSYACRNYCNDERTKISCNGGRYISSVSSCVCDCFATGKKGLHCYKDSPVISLRSNMDFISMKVVALSNRKFNKIRLRFKTRQQNGILVTLGNSNIYLTLELFLGRVRLETNVGAGKVVIMSSHELDDGLWHDVQIKQHTASFTMIVDDRIISRFEETKKSPFGHAEAGCGGNDIVYLGGHFNPITAFGSTSKQGFVGCLQQFQYYEDGNIIEDIIEKIKYNLTILTDYEIDGKVNIVCDVTERPPSERKPRRRPDPKTVQKTTELPNFVAQPTKRENSNPISSGQQQPNLDKRTSKKLKKSSVAWITAGIVIGAVILILTLGLVIHRFRKKYRGSFMAPRRDETGVPYYSSVQASYHTQNGAIVSGRGKHRGNSATDV
eukprot:gene4634-5241_t